MILNLSSRLAAKLKCKPESKSEDAPIPYQEWYGHIFYASKKPYILSIEANSIFTAIIEAKGINDPEHYADSLIIEIKDLGKIYGIPEQVFQVLSSRTDGVVVRRSSNRSRISHVNEMIYHSRSYMEERGLTSMEASIMVNEMPIKLKDMEFPIEVFAGRNIERKSALMNRKLALTSYI